MVLQVSSVGAEPLRVEKNDSIVILGNTFAERMQIFGYFETFLHCRFPGHKLRIRNMGWSADEVDKRIRPMGFPDLFDELKELEADLIFLCFGFNESFQGPGRLGHYRTELGKFLTELSGRKFNGESAPRIVLVSPLAFESLGGDLPNGGRQNENLKLYSSASAQVAKRHRARFLDLFTPSLSWMAKHPDQDLTFNGIHLTEYGDYVVSQMMARGLELLGETALPAEEANAAAEKLRRAVYVKNHRFFAWWHPPNASYIHGRRNKTRGSLHLAEEREHRKFFINYSESIVWGTVKPKASEVWASLPVEGKPVWNPTVKSRLIPGIPGGPAWEVEGDGPPDKHLRSPEEQLKLFVVADGYQVNLFASEVRFPLANPFAIQFDAQGRLWVANTPTWPHSLPATQPADFIVILEDHDRDGVADRHTVFLENMKLIHGFALGDGGAYVAQVPNLIFAKDTSGNNVSDRVQTVLHGFGAEDAEHAMNNFRWSPGGSLHFSQGIFHNTQVETPYGPRRVKDAAVFRYTPRAHRLEIPVSHAFWNPYGVVFDHWGRGILLDASAGQYYPMDVLSTPFVFPKRKKRTDHLSFAPGGAIAAGCEFVRNRHFPPAVEGRFLVNHCEGNVGTHWYDLTPVGSVYKAVRHEPLVTCTDKTFRPVAMAWGPDGALYLADFYTHIFENVNFSKRHPGRDHAHGRIWRISHQGRPTLKAPDIEGRPVPDLLDLLKAYENSTRALVRNELRARPREAVIPALERWIAQLDASDPEHDHHLVEALWLYQAHGIVKPALLRQVLNVNKPEARLAATQVLRFWQDQVEGSIELIRARANDEDARVRLHAVLAGGHSVSPVAREVVLEVRKHAMDPGLEHALDQCVKFLEKAAEDQLAIVDTLVDQIEGGKNREAATVAFRGLERTAWPPARLDSLAQSVLAYLEPVPAASRDAIVFLESMALGRELAELLPQPRGAMLSKSLDALGVSTFLVKTIPGRILYDRVRVVVPAGREVNVVFENNDLMPHNLVVVEPGAVEEIGTAADLMAGRPDALAKGYLPSSAKVLWSTNLLQPGERQKLTFTTPVKPGEYPYLCTFPGHWRSMRGTLVVNTPPE